MSCYAQEMGRNKVAKVTTYPGRRSVAESVGERMALIRVAIGGSVRDQISQEALGALVGWDKYKVSRLERGAQPLSRDDAIAIAKVDPLRRGPGWLMFGDEDRDSAEGATPSNMDGLTPQLRSRPQPRDAGEEREEPRVRKGGKG